MFLSLTLHAAEPTFFNLKISHAKWADGGRSSFLNGLVKKELIDQLDSIYASYPSNYEFTYSPKNGLLKVNVQCSFDFYSIVDGRLIKDYSFNNRGYTCGSNLFLRNEAYYILGGKGYWNNHIDLMKFDSLGGSWELTQAKNQPLNYYPIGTYQNKQGIMALFGEYYNPRITQLEKEPFGFFMNWESKTWQPLVVETEGFNLSEIIQANPSHLFETEDYGIILSNTQLPTLGFNIWILIEKETGKLFLYEGSKSFELVVTPYKEVIGNTIRYFEYKNGSINEGKEMLIDLDEIRGKSKEVGEIRILEATYPGEQEKSTYLLLLLFMLLLLGIGVWRYLLLQKKKKELLQQTLDENKDAPEDNFELLQQLLVHDGEKLSSEDFDRLLNIDQIGNFDSKRIKRSRLIKGLNTQYEEKKGYPLITRIKNPDDKRFVFYKITF